MDIILVLNTAPAKKARYLEQAEEKHKLMEMIKLEVRRLEDKKYLEFKANELKATESYLKALVGNDNDIYKLKIDMIVKESEFKSFMNKAETADDFLNSAKMQARMKIAELGSLEVK